MPDEKLTVVASPLYQQAIEAFQEADGDYHMLEKTLVEGEFIPNMAVDGSHLKQQYLGLIQDLRDALEERNARLKAAQDLLRQQVALNVTKWRGPEGKPTLLDAGPFKVSSVTRRTFDPKSLLDLTKKKGLLERLLDISTTDKDGKAKKIVEQAYSVDYQAVYDWLKANKLDDVIDGAYDEEESTPQVKGPKPLTFIGDEVKR